MNPKEKARYLLKEYDCTTDNYVHCGMTKDHLNDLKHDVLIDTCTEIIKVCERINPYEIPYWESVIKELGRSA